MQTKSDLAPSGRSSL